MNTFEPIVGMEIHVELKTKSKMFCGCSADYFGHDPNTHCCPVCLGLPGALPVPNKKAIEWCVMLGLALNCTIPEHSKFDRKNYFYPDLAKGYQISQYDEPFAIQGSLEIDVPETPSSKNLIKKKIRIRRVHMEEDTGKLIHDTVNGEPCTLIDFNRSGVPLVEIVTEPDIRSSEEARIFLKKLHQIIRAVGISDADMEKGTMRLEPNISVKVQTGQSAPLKEFMDEKDLPNYKVEVKNINSFGFVKKAIDYEIKRHIELLKQGEIPSQETRGWDEKKNATYSQRSKEDAHDYRYFPEPDIPPIHWEKSEIDKIRSQIPELPEAKIDHDVNVLKIRVQDSITVRGSVAMSTYFDKAVTEANRLKVPLQPIANLIVNKKINIDKVSPEELVHQVQKSANRTYLTSDVMNEMINKILASHPDVIAQYKSGKVGVIMFLVGMVMKEAKGQADPQTVRKVLESQLK